MGFNLFGRCRAANDGWSNFSFWTIIYSPNIVERFKEPDLKATVLNRTVHDNVVIDHELVIRNFPEGIGSVEMLCIYTVESGYIKRAIFKVFNKQLARPLQKTKQKPMTYTHQNTKQKQ